MEQGKKIVLGVSAYLIAKGVLNLILGSFALTNIASLILQIGLALVLIKGIRNMNYIAALVTGIIALYHLPANISNFSANWIYLIEGILDIGVVALLVLAKDVKAFFENSN